MLTPHVEGSSAAVLRNWEEIKAAEKQAAAWQRRRVCGASGQGISRPRGSTVLFARCPRWLKPPSSAPRRRNPASTGRAGANCFPKLAEETAELEAEAARTTDPARKPAVEAELGDLLFTVVNLGRHLGVDAEMALRNCNLRFRRRFREMELRCAAAARRSFAAGAGGALGAGEKETRQAE